MNQKTTLNGADIDRISEELEAELVGKCKCQPRDAKRICLTTEELLLNIRNRLGDESAVDVALRKRFGKAAVELRFSAEPFDPRKDSEGYHSDNHKRAYGGG